MLLDRELIKKKEGEVGCLWGSDVEREVGR
jgi:hypothetical protein